MRTRRSRLATTLPFAVVLLLAGCGDESGSADGTTPPTAPAVTSPPSTAAPTTPAPSSALPDRDPDVTGRVGIDASGPTLAEPSDTYFVGMSLITDGTILVDANGDSLAPSDLTEGADVAVWIDGPCAESSPVQCQVLAVQLL